MICSKQARNTWIRWCDNSKTSVFEIYTYILYIYIVYIYEFIFQEWELVVLLGCSFLLYFIFSCVVCGSFMGSYFIFLLTISYLAQFSFSWLNCHQPSSPSNNPSLSTVLYFTLLHLFFFSCLLLSCLLLSSSFSSPSQSSFFLHQLSSLTLLFCFLDPTPAYSSILLPSPTLSLCWLFISSLIPRSPRGN